MSAADPPSQPSRSHTPRPGRGGRKRDRSRDPVILQATLDVLVHAGYDGMTLDAVAARAGAGKATVHRRWPTKEQLVLAAIASLGRPFERDELPDTGELRSDLMAVVESPWLGGTEPRVRTLAALTSVLTGSPALANAINAQMTEPYVDGYRQLLRRASRRGEIPPDADLDTAAQVIPAMSVYRMMFAKQPPDREFLQSVIDHVVLPALGLNPGPGNSRRRISDSS